MKSVFGIEALRPGQDLVIGNILDGKDTLAIMPTGSGKTLCYQLPAKMLAGTTLVISPLISLMKDQLEKLLDLGIRAVQINSTLSEAEEAQAFEGIREGQYEIIFCTPERICSTKFPSALGKTRIALFVVDEAHCISSWGHDFRPAFLELSKAVCRLGNPPVLALTATAPDNVVADIKEQLRLPDMAVVNTGVYRPNLHFRVIQTTNPVEKNTQALRLVQETRGAGIVYAATVKSAEELYRALEAVGESVTLYHGKLSARERERNQDAFMNGEKRVVIATNAFGMGIDKSDVRFVVHLQVPASLQAYYQEAGRAGRDGEAAECTLLYLQDDKRIQQFLLARHCPSADELRSVYELVRRLSETAKADMATLAEASDLPSTAKLKKMIALLKDGSLLRQNRKLECRLTARVPTDADFDHLAEINSHKQELDRLALEQMIGYAQSGYCRWKLLMEYFGDDASESAHCGCDNCLNPPSLQIDLPAELACEAVASAQPIAPEPEFTPGMLVKVPKFDVGTVLSSSGEHIVIDFAEHGTRTFVPDHVLPI